MLEWYQHDLSDIWDQDLDLHGEYGYALDRYWQDPNCHPYVFVVDGHYAGLGLVDKQVKVPGGDFWMDQFFVLKKYRRKGVAAQAAGAVFELHRGAWQVGQMPSNHAAQAFWRKAIAGYTYGKYTEHHITSGWWQGFVQCFWSKCQQ
jgi:predicted acetyltransferase